MGQQPSIRWPECDVLVVAGDTSNDIGTLIKFLTKTSKRTTIPHILVLDGNHEHYANANQKRTVQETCAKIAAQMPDRCTYLPSGPVQIGHLWFVGCNGWYSFDSTGDPIYNRSIWKDEMNDDLNIGFSRILQTPPWDLAELDASYVSETVAAIRKRDPDARFVIATHTAPHRQMLSPNPKYIRTNPFYVNTKMEAVLEQHAEAIAVWVHGHTHHRNEKFIHGTYVIANPRGYPRENPSWEPVVLDL